MKTYTRCSSKGKSKHSCNSKFTKKKKKKTQGISGCFDDIFAEDS